MVTPEGVLLLTSICLLTICPLSRLDSFHRPLDALALRQIAKKLGVSHSLLVLWRQGKRTLSRELQERYHTIAASGYNQSGYNNRSPEAFTRSLPRGPVAQSGQSIGLLIRVSRVRIPAGSLPIYRITKGLTAICREPCFVQKRPFVNRLSTRAPGFCQRHPCRGVRRLTICRTSQRRPAGCQVARGCRHRE